MNADLQGASLRLLVLLCVLPVAVYPFRHAYAERNPASSHGGGSGIGGPLAGLVAKPAGSAHHAKLIFYTMVAEVVHFQ
jgi:hypothetical protein